MRPRTVSRREVKERSRMRVINDIKNRGQGMGSREVNK